jgi:hypothetical protein
MTAIPDAAVAVITAALDDYRLTTTPAERTPRGAAARVAECLTSSGWGLTTTRTQPAAPRARAVCPACTVRHLITAAGRVRRHGPRGHPCPGSGAPARTEPAPSAARATEEDTP